MSKKALIVQGGAYRTAFSVGVLDAFIDKQYNPFDLYISVSGGAVATSYFLAGQRKFCFDAMCLLSEDKEFVRYRRLLKKQPMMNIDFFREVTKNRIPLDIIGAKNALHEKQMEVVMTNRVTGEPHYCQPGVENWMDVIIASCSMPMITKGAQVVGNQTFLDGAWSDSLPIKRAISQGATAITIVRTQPVNDKVSQGLIDQFGALFSKKNSTMKRIYSENHKNYNASIEFIKNPPANIKIYQIAPDSGLNAGNFVNSPPILKKDYDNGYARGLEFLRDSNS